MATSHLDWRELKKELFTSPRPRTSQTFIHSDIFGAKGTAEQIERNNPTNQANVGKSSYKTPKKVRENDTTRSFVLDKSETKLERPVRSYGKKTYTARPTIHPGNKVRVGSPNPHRIPDHRNEWFFEQTSEKPRSLATTVVDRHTNTTHDLSPHRQRKQEELFMTEVAGTHLLNPDSTQLSLVPRVRAQPTSGEITRQLSTDRNPTEKRLLHNESNLFHQIDYQSKLKFPIQRERKQPAEESFVHTDAFSPAEIDHIKRLNHNFSDVFGLEYGSRERIQAKKAQVRNLSPTLLWTNVDSIKNRKDIGTQHSEGKQVGSYHHHNQLNKSRSRVLDQRSTLDTHEEYDKPLPKTNRLVVNRPTVQRTTAKKQKW